MNNNYGVLEWGNENSLSSYPLSQWLEVTDFIIDASFVQFDGFIPTLKTLSVNQVRVVLVIGTDAGDLTLTINKPTGSYFPGYTVALSLAGRRLGSLVFGQGLVNIFSTHLNTTMRLNIPFLSSVVRGVNSSAGVYSFAGYTGDVQVFTGTTRAEQTIFFDQSLNGVAWNAGALTASANGIALKTLNSVHPINNAVIIEDSELIKIYPQAAGLLVGLGVPLGYNAISPSVRYQ